MPLLNTELTIWDISHRWAGYDPSSFRLSHQLLVKDYFQLLISAVYSAEILCRTLCLDKRPQNSKSDPSYYIRGWDKELNDCLSGKHFDKTFLKWAVLDRMDLLEWCERRGIPLPDFWFPPGWKLDYEVPKGGYPGHRMKHLEPENDRTPAAFTFRWNDEVDDEESDINVVSEEENTPQRKLTHMQSTKIACQAIAINIWKIENDKTIADMARSNEILVLGGAKRYSYEVVRRWLSEVAPPHIKARRGRRSIQENTTEED
ncbi:MAG: hypothetical protein WC696_00340 [Candidatus Methylopumilus sp.]|jgi:hypothetical protein